MDELFGLVEMGDIIVVNAFIKPDFAGGNYLK